MDDRCNLEIKTSVFDITEKSNKFQLYKFPDLKLGVISYEKVRNENEKDLERTNITAADLQDDIKSPFIFEKYGGQVTKRMKTDNYMYILAVYNTYIFQDFESFLRTEVDFLENDIRLVLDENSSSLITYELEPGFYTSKDFSETLKNS